MKHARRLIARIAGAVVFAAIVLVSVAVHPQSASADNLWLHSCSFYGNDDVATGLWATQYAFNDTGAWTNDDRCGSPGINGGFGLSTNGGVWGTHWEQWGTSSPVGIEIDSAWTPPCYWPDNCQFSGWHGALIECDLASLGYSAWYVWGGGAGQQQITNNDGGNCYPGNLADGTPINRSFAGTNFFGFQLACDKPNNQLCGRTSDPAVALTGLQLGATETAVPSINAAGTNNLYHSGWVRGDGWSIGFQASDPSGVCNMRAWLNGQLIQGTTATPNQGYWDQCDPEGSPQGWTGPTIGTTDDRNGTQFQLSYQAEDAAGNWSQNATTTSRVDNSQVTLGLTGRQEASVAAGTQYVTATSSVNPSGDSIWCRTDGGPWTAHGGTRTEIPVSGLGDHHVSCFAQDSAVDNNGAPGRSAVQTRALKIGDRVDSGITFSRVIRSCRRVRVHVHKHHRNSGVLRCHTRTPERQVESVPHGRRTTLHGWFATADGGALSHVPVGIYAALDNGLHHWQRLETVSTAGNGSWRATIPAGPSRLLEAEYGGGPLTDRATSRVATVLVRATSTLSFAHVVHFGNSVQFVGRLLGGYVPPTGAIVVVEAFDRGQWRGISTVRTNRSGRWGTSYTLNGGAGHYPIRVRIPRQAAYPWAAGLTAPQTLDVQP